MHAITEDYWLVEIRDRVEDALQMIAEREQDARAWRVLVDRGAAKPSDRPVYDFRADIVADVREIAQGFKELDADFVSQPDLLQAVQDVNFIDPVLEALLELPEFQTIRSYPIHVVWSLKAMTQRDLVDVQVVPGKASPVPQLERDTWTGDGSAPWFRLVVSLPFWLIATQEQREWSLHHLLSSVGVSGNKPARRRPDIVGYASTLARYGLHGPREASAVAHVAAHPTTPRRLRKWRFNMHGQGCLWGPADSSLQPEDRHELGEDQPPLPTRARPVSLEEPPRVGKDAAAGPD